MSLHFRQDGTFTIVQFTDVHWTDGNERDEQTRELMDRVVETEQPDLVVLTGDTIAGGQAPDPAQAWNQAVEVLHRREVPWAAVFGNHDDEGCLSRRDLMEIQQRHRMCLSEPGPDEVPGVGNYILTVQPRTSHAQPSILYFLDSGSYAPELVGGYAWIPPGVVSWYRETATHVRQTYGKGLLSLAFFHIPLPEYNDLWNYRVCAGVKQEDVCCPRLNSGLFCAMLEMDDMMGVFVGHDHTNDYIGEFGGIHLAYGRGSGYNTYGKEGFERGARIIRLYEGKQRFDTWLRLADGTAVMTQPRHEPDDTVRQVG